jgi:hypothetical protein
MDIKTWSKDQTKNRDDEVDFPANAGRQSPSPNRFQQAAKIFFQILLAWIGLEVTGLRYTVSMNPQSMLVAAGIVLLIVCLRYFHMPIRVGIGVLFHRIIPAEDAAVVALPSTMELEDQPNLVDGPFSHVYVGDDGELVFNRDPEAKLKREES